MLPAIDSMHSDRSTSRTQKIAARVGAATVITILGFTYGRQQFSARHLHLESRVAPAPAPVPWPDQAVEAALNLSDSTLGLQLLVRAADQRQREAGIQDRAVLVTIANYEGVNSLLPVFSETLHRVAPVLASTTIVLAVGLPAFERCRKHRLLCFFDKEATQRSEELAETASSLPRNKSPQFLQIGWDKLKRLQDALVVNTTILFADTDIVWLQDPLPHLERDRAADLQLTHDGWGPNIGLMYVRATPCITLFMRDWLARRDAPTARDQYEFAAAVNTTKATCTDLKVEYLDKASFPNGCCCGREYTEPSGREWVLWHAACGGDLLTKRGYLDSISEASRAARSPARL